jgi:hypothetical protein
VSDQNQLLMLWSEELGVRVDGLVLEPPLAGPSHIDHLLKLEPPSSCGSLAKEPAAQSFSSGGSIDAGYECISDPDTLISDGDQDLVPPVDVDYLEAHKGSSGEVSGRIHEDDIDDHLVEVEVDELE